MKFKILKMAVRFLLGLIFLSFAAAAFADHFFNYRISQLHQVLVTFHRYLGTTAFWLLIADFFCSALVIFTSKRPVRSFFSLQFLAASLIGQFILRKHRAPGLALLLGGPALYLILVRPKDDTPVRRRVSLLDKKKVFTLFILISVLTSLLRFYRIDDFEQRYCFSRDSTIDEAFKGQWAMDFLTGITPYKPFIRHWGERETLYIYCEVLTILLFGQNPMALKFVSIMSGILAIFFLFFLMQRLFNSRKALAGMFLFGISPWLLAMNRISERFNFVPLFTVLAVWLFVRAVQKETAGSWILAGFFGGLGMYTFPSYRVVPVIMLGGMFLWSVGQKKFLRFNWYKMILYWIVFTIVVMTPLMWDINAFIYHFVSAQEHSFKMYRHKSDLGEYLSQLVGFFNYRFRGDMAYWDDGPLLLPFTAVLYLFGLGMSIFNSFFSKRKKVHLFLLLWFLISFLPVIISDPVPRRLGVTQPLLYIFAGNALMSLATMIFYRPVKTGKAMQALFVTIALLTVSGFGIHRFFTRTYNVFEHPDCPEYQRQEFVRANGRYFTVFMTHLGEYQELLYYYKHSNKIDDNQYKLQTINPQDNIPIHYETEKNVLYSIREKPEFERYLPLFSEYHPSSRLITHYNKEDQPMFYTVFIPHDDIEAAQGLKETIFRGEPAFNRPLLESKRIKPTAQWSEIQLTKPYTVLWTGSWFAPESNVYRFTTKGDTPCALYIDDNEILNKSDPRMQESRARFLMKGFHSIQVRAEVIKNCNTLQIEFPFVGVRMKMPAVFFTPFAPRDDPFKAVPIELTDLSFRLEETPELPSPFTDEPIKPTFLEIGPDGSIYVSDSERVTIAKYDADFKFERAWHPLKPEIGSWTTPQPITWERNYPFLFKVTRQGEVFTVPAHEQVLRIYDESGKLKKTVRQLPGHLHYFYSTFEGELYALLSYAPFKWTDEGFRPLFPNVHEKMKGMDPMAMAVDPARNRVYFHDGSWERIHIFDMNGNVVGGMENIEREDNPMLRIDKQGRLYFSALRTHWIRTFSLDNKLLLEKGKTDRKGLFEPPDLPLGRDLEIDASGQVFFLSFEGKIIKYVPEG